MTATDVFSSRRDAGTGLGHKRQTAFTFAGMSSSALFFLFRSVLGMMFIMSGLGLWFLPGGVDVPEVRVMQMGVTAFFLLIGYALLRGNPPAQRPELHIDLIRRSVEIGIRDMTGGVVSMARYQMEELSDIAVIGTQVLATDISGNEVISLDLEDNKAAQTLCEFLKALPPLGRTQNVFA